MPEKKKLKHKNLVNSLAVTGGYRRTGRVVWYILGLLKKYGWVGL